MSEQYTSAVELLDEFILYPGNYPEGSELLNYLIQGGTLDDVPTVDSEHARRVLDEAGELLSQLSHLFFAYKVTDDGATLSGCRLTSKTWKELMTLRNRIDNYKQYIGGDETG